MSVFFYSRQPVQFQVLNLQRPSANDLVMTPGVFKVLGLLIKHLQYNLYISMGPFTG